MIASTRSIHPIIIFIILVIGIYALMPLVPFIRVAQAKSNQLARFRQGSHKQYLLKNFVHFFMGLLLAQLDFGLVAIFLLSHPTFAGF